MTDFTFNDDGTFTQIIPETKAAQECWNTEIAPKTDGTGKVLSVHFPKVREQLREAGYTIRKAKPSTQSADSLLKELLK